MLSTSDERSIESICLSLSEIQKKLMQRKEACEKMKESSRNLESQYIRKKKDVKMQNSVLLERKKERQVCLQQALSIKLKYSKFAQTKDAISQHIANLSTKIHTEVAETASSYSADAFDYTTVELKQTTKKSFDRRDIVAMHKSKSGVFRRGQRGQQCERILRFITTMPLLLLQKKRD